MTDKIPNFTKYRATRADRPIENRKQWRLYAATKNVVELEQRRASFGRGW